VKKIAAAHPDRRIEVWFEDEARFGQQGTITRVWARRGTRPRVVKQTQYDYVHVYAAVCPASGQAEGLITPQLNTATTNVFLEQLSRQLAPDVHAVLIWDGAGFHRSGELKVPGNITLLPLPPYSPELNPVENLWHYLRSHYWSNREHKDYDALCETVCSSWQDACLDEERIKTVCHVGYLEKAQ
jgi:transposase